MYVYADDVGIYIYMCIVVLDAARRNNSQTLTAICVRIEKKITSLFRVIMMMLLICADAATPPMVLSIWCVQNKLLYSLFGGNMHFFFVVDLSLVKFFGNFANCRLHFRLIYSSL